MIMKIRGVIHGNTIEVREDLRGLEGQQVEVTIERVTAPEEELPPPVSAGLPAVYAILGERFNSGHHDTAARHNEHQP